MAIDNEPGEGIAEPVYKTLFYRHAFAPPLVSLGIVLAAVLSPRLVSIAAVGLGLLVVIGETVVYLTRFRALPPSESWNPPLPKRLIDRLTLQGLALTCSHTFVIFRAFGLVAFSHGRNAALPGYVSSQRGEADLASHQPSDFADSRN